MHIIYLWCQCSINYNWIQIWNDFFFLLLHVINRISFISDPFPTQLNYKCSTCAFMGWQTAMYLSTVNAVKDKADTLMPRYWRYTNSEHPMLPHIHLKMETYYTSSDLFDDIYLHQTVTRFLQNQKHFCII